MRYFITGSAGFIGFHLAKALLEAGHDVFGFDAMTPYYDVNLKQRRQAILEGYDRFEHVVAALENRRAVEEAFARSAPDVVIHLAAQAGVRYSLENPQAYLDSNLVGSWNLFDTVKDSGIKHLLIASSSSIYGANPKIPFEETDHTDEPLTVYAATKKSMEVVAHSYSHLHKLPTTAFRFFTVYGPWGRPDMALFKFVSAILQDREIELYGEGKVRRDFTYIDDLIEAIIRLADIPPSEDNRITDGSAADTLSRHAPFRTVNIGLGHPIDVHALVAAVEEALGRTARTRLLPMQKGDVPQTFASAKLLKALTGFGPTVGISEGVRAFADWYRSEYPSV
ncbi:NAD-dependent epimerase/dehydratase family protein [Rhizobium sp.]